MLETFNNDTVNENDTIDSITDNLLSSNEFNFESNPKNQYSTQQDLDLWSASFDFINDDPQIDEAFFSHNSRNSSSASLNLKVDSNYKSPESNNNPNNTLSYPSNSDFITPEYPVESNFIHLNHPSSFNPSLLYTPDIIFDQHTSPLVCIQHSPVESPLHSPNYINSLAAPLDSPLSTETLTGSYDLDLLDCSLPKESTSDKLSPITKRKKTTHSAVERKYRNSINNQINELRNSVPALLHIKSKDLHPAKPRPKSHGADDDHDGDDEEEEEYIDGVAVTSKISKSTILTKATEYISHLKRQSDEVNQENDTLQFLLSQLPGGQAILDQFRATQGKEPQPKRFKKKKSSSTDQSQMFMAVFIAFSLYPPNPPVTLPSFNHTLTSTPSFFSFDLWTSIRPLLFLLILAQLLIHTLLNQKTTPGFSYRLLIRSILRFILRHHFPHAFQDPPNLSHHPTFLPSLQHAFQLIHHASPDGLARAYAITALRLPPFARYFWRLAMDQTQLDPDLQTLLYNPHLDDGEDQIDAMIASDAWRLTDPYELDPIVSLTGRHVSDNLQTLFGRLIMSLTLAEVGSGSFRGLEGHGRLGQVGDAVERVRAGELVDLGWQESIAYRLRGAGQVDPVRAMADLRWKVMARQDPGWVLAEFAVGLLVLEAWIGCWRVCEVAEEVKAEGLGLRRLLRHPALQRLSVSRILVERLCRLCTFVSVLPDDIDSHPSEVALKILRGLA